MRVVWQFLALMAVCFVAGQSVVVVQSNPWLTVAVGLVGSVLALLVYRWIVGRTEHRVVTEAAWNGAGSGIWWGTVIGFLLFTCVIVNIAFLDGYEVHGIASPAGMVGMIGFMAGSAVTEEILFRGFLFRLIEERLGTWIALLVTAVIFGLSHLLNPHQSLWGAIAIAIEAGGMLAAAYLVTRSLWLPIGVHFGWNFAAGGIFSTEVSGNNTPQGLLDASSSGPELLTGGAFGPEGSMYAVVFGLITTVVLMWIAYRRGNVLPRRRGETRVNVGPTLPQ